MHLAQHWSRWRGRCSQSGNQRQNVGDHLPQHRDLGQLESNVAPMANDGSRSLHLVFLARYGESFRRRIILIMTNFLTYSGNPKFSIHHLQDNFLGLHVAKTTQRAHARNVPRILLRTTITYGVSTQDVEDAGLQGCRSRGAFRPAQAGAYARRGQRRESRYSAALASAAQRRLRAPTSASASASGRSKRQTKRAIVRPRR